MAKKASQIELELNRATEGLALNTQKVDGREKALLAAEMEVFNLNKKVQALDGTAEQLDDRILSATHRLDNGLDMGSRVLASGCNRWKRSASKSSPGTRMRR